MKINENVKKALGSAEFWTLFLMFAGVVILLALWPGEAWLKALGCFLFIIAIRAVQIASDFKNRTPITTGKTGEGTDPDKEEK